MNCNAHNINLAFQDAVSKVYFIHLFIYSGMFMENKCKPRHS